MASGNSILGRDRSPQGMKLFASMLLMLVVITTESTGVTLENSASSFEFRPGIIVDPRRSTIYLMNSERGIDAVDLTSGKMHWRTDRAAKPLLHYEERLLAQTEPGVGQQFLRIALLSTRNITADPLFIDIPLPAGVLATIDDGMESSFSAAVRVYEAALVLSWQYSYNPITGPPPDPDLQALDRKTTGSVRIDIHTGKISPIGEVTVLPELELPSAVVRLQEAQALPGRVWRVNDILVAIERSTHQGKQRVSLKRWDAKTGQALTDVTLFRSGLNFRSVSTDQRHLLASRRNAANSSIWEWAIFSLETGRKVAELKHDEPGARFFLSGSRLIHETNVIYRQIKGQVVVEPTKLRAINLETGTEVWSHAIRDTKYRGPYPPRAIR